MILIKKKKKNVSTLLGFVLILYYTSVSISLTLLHFCLLFPFYVVFFFLFILFTRRNADRTTSRSSMSLPFRSYSNSPEHKARFFSTGAHVPGKVTMRGRRDEKIRRGPSVDGTEKIGGERGRTWRGNTRILTAIICEACYTSAVYAVRFIRRIGNHPSRSEAYTVCYMLDTIEAMWQARGCNTRICWEIDVICILVQIPTTDLSYFF